jgi:hypothetical protein
MTPRKYLNVSSIFPRSRFCMNIFPGWIKANAHKQYRYLAEEEGVSEEDSV